MLDTLKTVFENLNLLYSYDEANPNISEFTVVYGKIQVGRNLRNPGRDISFPIFTRKEIETKRIRKEIKTIISRLNHFLSFLSNI